MVEGSGRPGVQDLVFRALQEDIGSGDITTLAIVPADALARAALVVKSACVVAGLDVVEETFRQLDAGIRMERLRHDGDRCEAGAVLARLAGRARPMLTGERTALNFLQHLSGVATETRRHVDAARGRLVVLDTRKTLPGLRALEKQAVRCGGGHNHRFGLHDGVLIKDNHIRQAGGIGAAVARVRAAGLPQPIEVETQSLAEVDEALASGADVIMLDNLDDATMRQAIARIGGRARTEISGGVTLHRLAALADLGADTVSIGAITHSAPAADISLEFEPA